MKHKLHSILLIDDDNNCNFIHERLLFEYGCTEHVEIAKDGCEGLKILKSLEPKPEIIFLDINMPGMNGWEFLEEYDKLPEDEKSKIVIVMLTSSLNPDDQQRAKSYSCVSDYCNKLPRSRSRKPHFREIFPGIYVSGFLFDSKILGVIFKKQLDFYNLLTTKSFKQEINSG